MGAGKRRQRVKALPGECAQWLPCLRLSPSLHPHAISGSPPQGTDVTHPSRVASAARPPDDVTARPCVLVADAAARRQARASSSTQAAAAAHAPSPSSLIASPVPVVAACFPDAGSWVHPRGVPDWNGKAHAFLAFFSRAMNVGYR